MTTGAQKRLEAALRWAARVSGWIFVAVFLVFFVGEAFIPPATEDVNPVTRVDAVGLSLMVLGLFGFVVAWWRPIEGGVLGILGVILPSIQSFSFGNIPWAFLVVALVGALHVADGLLRRQGIGPRIARLRPPRPAV